MKTTRATLHMALAAYSAKNPDKQVLSIARRVKRTTSSKRTQRAMKRVLDAPYPAALVLQVVDESF